MNEPCEDRWSNNRLDDYIIMKCRKPDMEECIICEMPEDECFCTSAQKKSYRDDMAPSEEE